MKTILLKAAAPMLLLGCMLIPAASQAGPLYNHNINERLNNQQARIHQGMRAGDLNTAQRYRLDARDANIRYRTDRDRAADHGRLTLGEHRRLERSLNRTSGAIYRDKH